MDEDILELVAQNDQAFEIDESQDFGSLESIDERPAPADGGSNEVSYFFHNFVSGFFQNKSQTLFWKNARKLVILGNFVETLSVYSVKNLLCNK